MKCMAPMKMHLFILLVLCQQVAAQDLQNASIADTEVDAVTVAIENENKTKNIIDAETEDWKVALEKQRQLEENIARFARYRAARDAYDKMCYIIIWPALLLNGLSLAVFSYKYSLNKSQTVNILLMALAITDCLSLVIVFDTVLYNWTGLKYSLMQNTDIGCKVLPFIAETAQCCSSYIILTFTVERVVSVYYPLKKTIWITHKTIALALITIIIYSMVIQSYKFSELKLNYAGNACASDNNHIMTINLIIRYGLGFLPANVMVAILNILLIRKLQKWTAKRAAMTSKEGSNKMNRSLTGMLVTVSTFSFLVSMPKCFMQIVAVSIPSLVYKVEAIEAVYITDALSMLNYSCNFLFYCVAGSQFRRDFLMLVRRVLGKKSGRTFLLLISKSCIPL